MTLVAAALLGVLIGISLGALGGGGSILTVPALVYLLGQSPQTATTASLVIVGISAVVGALGHARAGTLRWVTGVVFGLLGVAASFLGTALNRQVAPNVLLLAFAALMLVSAAAMLRRAAGSTPAPAGAEPDAAANRPVPVEAGPGELGGGGGLATAARRRTVRRPQLDTATVLKTVVAALFVGFLTGFLGVGGGFVIVPALVMALGLPMPVAVGTSLLVIAINSGSSLLARPELGSLPWGIVVPFTLAAIGGSLVGRRVGARLPAAVLTRSFAGLLVAVGTYVAIRSVLAF